MLTTLPARPRHGLTLVETLSFLFLTVILISIVTVYIPSYINATQKTTNINTLEALNKGLELYKITGGMKAAHSLGGYNTASKMSAIVTALKSGFTSSGLKKTFVDQSSAIDATKLYASGSGMTFYFCGYGATQSGGNASTNTLAGTYNAYTNSEEFNVAGGTYYAVAPAGYAYNSDQDTAYGSRKYTTLAAAVAALPATATTPVIINILGSWSSPETNYIVINNIVTTASNYLHIRTIGAARHNGAYTSTAYRLVNTNTWKHTLKISTAYCTIGGLQVSNTGTDGGQGAYHVYDNCVVTTLYDDIAYNCPNGYGFFLEVGTIKATNCVATGASNSGFYVSARATAVAYLYNCVAANNTVYGFYVRGYRTMYVKNCYAGNNPSGDFFPQDVNAHLYITTSPSSDATGTSTVAFSTSSGTCFTNTTAGSENFHISASSALKGIGTNLSADSYWTHPKGYVDIDTNTRSVPWSIGVDQ